MSDEVTLEYLRSQLNNEKVFVIDVREPHELESTGKIPGSINIPLKTLEDTFKNLNGDEFRAKFDREKPDLNAEILFSCQSGRRSKVALDAIKALGFVNAKHYPKGWLGWAAGSKTKA